MHPGTTPLTTGEPATGEALLSFHGYREQRPQTCLSPAACLPTNRAPWSCPAPPPWAGTQPEGNVFPGGSLAFLALWECFMEALEKTLPQSLPTASSVSTCGLQTSQITQALDTRVGSAPSLVLMSGSTESFSVPIWD